MQSILTLGPHCPVSPLQSQQGLVELSDLSNFRNDHKINTNLNIWILYSYLIWPDRVKTTQSKWKLPVTPVKKQLFVQIIKQDSWHW